MGLKSRPLRVVLLQVVGLYVGRTTTLSMRSPVGFSRWNKKVLVGLACSCFYSLCIYLSYSCLIVLPVFSWRINVVKRAAMHQIAVVTQPSCCHRLDLHMDSRLGLAIVPLCRGTGAPFDERRRPLAPSKFFWRVRYGEKFYYRCGPLPTPLVVMKRSE